MNLLLARGEESSGMIGLIALDGAGKLSRTCDMLIVDDYSVLGSSLGYNILKPPFLFRRLNFIFGDRFFDNSTLKLPKRSQGFTSLFLIEDWGGDLNNLAGSPMKAPLSGWVALMFTYGDRKPP